MKIQINPEVVKVHGAMLRGKLFGKPVDSDGVYEVKADEWKILKGLTATAGGRKLPMWVEVAKPDKE